jgi:hypothetical protein
LEEEPDEEEEEEEEEEEPIKKVETKPQIEKKMEKLIIKDDSDEDEVTNRRSNTITNQRSNTIKKETNNRSNTITKNTVVVEEEEEDEADDQNPFVDGNSINIKTNYKTFLSAQTDKKLTQSKKCTISEQFILESAENGLWAIKTCHSTYLSIQKDGTVSQNNKSTINEWFTVEAYGDDESDKYALKGYGDKYLKFKSTGVVSTSDEVEDDELVDIIKVNEEEDEL